MDLSSQHISPRLLIPFVGKIANLHLSNVTVDPKDAEQWEDFFSTITSSEDLQLKFISISENILIEKNVHPEILANALCKISSVNAKLYRSAKILFETIVKNEFIAITDLNLRNSKDIKEIDQSLLATAICKIETVCLLETHLSSKQLFCIYSTILTCDNLVLKNFDVRNGFFMERNPDAQPIIKPLYIKYKKS